MNVNVDIADKCGRWREAQNRGCGGIRVCWRPALDHIVTHADVIAGRYPAARLGSYESIEEEVTYVRALYSRHASGLRSRALASS